MKKAIGLNYPIKRSDDGYFDKTFTTIEHTKANIINVLSTKKGERIGRPEFGTNLESLLFNELDEKLEADIRSEIETNIERFLPYVTIENLVVSRNPEKNLASVELSFTTVFLPGKKQENVQVFFELTEQV